MKAFITDKKKKKALIYILTAVFWLAVWFALSCIVNSDLLLPSPVSTGKALLQLVETRDFWLAVGLTILRISAGFISGVMLGCLLAVLTVYCKPAEYLLSPIISIIRSIPVASFIMLVILFVSRDILPVLICFLMVMPIIWSNTVLGIKSVDDDTKEWARIYKLCKAKRLRYIYLPATLPYIETAAVTALGFAWKSGIAAEVLSLPKASVGYGIYQSKTYLLTPQLFAWTAVVIIISILLEVLLKRLLKRIKGRRYHEA